MISSVIGVSRDECKRIDREIAQVVVARCKAAAVAVGLHPIPSFAQCQSAEIDTEIPNKYVPTQAEIVELEEIERVVLDKEDTCMDIDNPEDEDTLASHATQVSNLEKTQNDILTLLHLMNDCLNASSDSI